MRLFVALDIPEDVRVALLALMEKLRPACREAKWVRVGNAHITLKFIGEAPEGTLERIKNAVASIRLSAPIALIFRGIGFFPNPKRPRVLWAGIETGPELTHLAGIVSAKLEPLGIEKEHREFSPHITLAQFKSPAGVKGLQHAIANAGPLEFGSAVATEFHLYQSVLKPTGAEYTRLATYRFAEGGSH